MSKKKAEDPIPEPTSGKTLLKHVPIDLLVPNEWNAQDQDQATFQRLVDEIIDNGFISALEVVPLDDGKFRILGGEHRWMAAKRAIQCLEEMGDPTSLEKAAKLEELPASVLTDEKWQDEDLQKFVSVRLNVIRGHLDPEKFLKLYEEMAAKYGKESLQQLMGYTDSKKFQKLVDGLKKGMQKALPKELSDEFDQKAKDAKTAEDLQKIVQELFTKYGDTLDLSFMVFTFGKQEHVYITMSRKMRKTLSKVQSYCKMTGTDMNDFMEPFVGDYLEKKLEEVNAAAGQPQDQ